MDRGEVEMITISIEKLLHWAFVMELPRAHDGDGGPTSVSSSWTIVERIGELGTMVDGTGGGIADVADPHPDAIAIAAAVDALDTDFTVVEGEDHDLLAGWPDFGQAGDAAIRRAWDIVSMRDGADRVVLRSGLAALVRRVAILGQWPDWRADAPQAVLETGPEGKPRWHRITRVEVRWSSDGTPIMWTDVEVDGWDRVRRRPHKGAYRKSVLVPDVSSVLARRLEYGLTHAALTGLAARLDGIGGRRVLPPQADASPWALAAEVEKIVA